MDLRPLVDWIAGFFVSGAARLENIVLNAPLPIRVTAQLPESLRSRLQAVRGYDQITENIRRGEEIEGIADE